MLHCRSAQWARGAAARRGLQGREDPSGGISRWPLAQGRPARSRPLALLQWPGARRVAAASAWSDKKHPENVVPARAFGAFRRELTAAISASPEVTNGDAPCPVSLPTSARLTAVGSQRTRATPRLRSTLGCPSTTCSAPASSIAGKHWASGNATRVFVFPLGRLLAPNTRRWSKQHDIDPWLASRPVERDAFDDASAAAEALP